MKELDLREASSKPIILENQVLVLGNPVIPVSTMQELVRKLDELGLGQPIVIINPEANTVPNFDQLLSNLIQNNRKHPEVNVTTDDKYRFKDMTDDQLNQEVHKVVQGNPSIEFDSMLNIYQGLRARSQALYCLDVLQRERDQIWSFHCANPSSPDGQARFTELVYSLIPQAQQYYDWVCSELNKAEVKYINPNENTVAAGSSVIADVPVTVEETAIRDEIEEKSVAPVDVEIKDSSIDSTSVHLWGPWNNILMMQMPIPAAAGQVDSVYRGLREQQHDVVRNGVTYKAVEPEVLLALGIDIYQDGVPVVYSSLGTFLRIGNSNRSINDLAYWYPKPKVLR